MPKKNKLSISCDWKRKPDSGNKLQADNKSRLCRYKGDFSWQGIKKERYKREWGNWADIVRQTLIGDHGESARFHLRYFELAPGGFSSYEVHKHEHVVVGIRGSGLCVVKKKSIHINFLDTLYIAPNTPHQLRNPYTEPFGFFCIVNAKRDKPRVL